MTKRRIYGFIVACLCWLIPVCAAAQSSHFYTGGVGFYNRISFNYETLFNPPFSLLFGLSVGRMSQMNQTPYYGDAYFVAGRSELRYYPFNSDLNGIFAGGLAEVSLINIPNNAVVYTKAQSMDGAISAGVKFGYKWARMGQYIVNIPVRVGVEAYATFQTTVYMTGYFTFWGTIGLDLQMEIPIY